MMMMILTDFENSFTAAKFAKCRYTTLWKVSVAFPINKRWWWWWWWWWWRFYYLQISDARLASESRSGEEREMRSLGRHPTYFQWDKGRVVRVFLSDDDTTFTANIKKGIVDMFQLRTDDSQHHEVIKCYFLFFSLFNNLLSFTFPIL